MNSFTQGLGGVVREMMGQNGNSTYISQLDIELAKIADTIEWKASEKIRQIVPDADNVKVELVDLNLDLNKVHNTMVQEGTVGIVLFGSIIDRQTKPKMIVLVTEKVLYAIDPLDAARGMAFFRIKLKDERIHFWTTNGVQESDCLYHQFNIDLREHNNVSCCTGYHVNLMRTMQFLPEATTLKYPKGARDLCRRPARLESFKNLITIWLDLDHSEILCEQAQLSHLGFRPLNLTCQNFIKKRCILVGPLIKTLEYYSTIELKKMNRNIFDRLILANDIYLESMISYMKDTRIKGQPDLGYYTHLDIGYRNTRPLLNDRRSEISTDSKTSHNSKE